MSSGATKISEELANKIWDILLAHAGASPHDRANFIICAIEHGITEYRFCGSLGFGGKFWINNGKMYITYYQEDKTEERDKTVIDINNKLESLTL